MVYICTCYFRDSVAANVVVHSAQRGRCDQVFRLAIWLGPRQGKCYLVLVEECRPLYSAYFCGSFMERQTSACLAPVTPVSRAFQFMLHHPQRTEDGAL